MSTGDGARTRRRDRRGRGVRGNVVPPGLPGYRSIAQRFDDLVIEAAGRLARRWPTQMAAIEVAVEDVPLADPATWSAGVPMGRVVPATIDHGVRLIVHRHAVASRADEDLPRLVYVVLVEQLAEALGRSPQEIDPDVDPDNF